MVKPGSFLDTPLAQFFVGGTLLASVTYAANTMKNTKLAGLLVAFPIELIPLIWMYSDKTTVDYSYDAMITLGLVIVSLGAFLVVNKIWPEWPQYQVFFVAFLFWIVMAGFAYVYLLK
jgi:hypothetical protein